MEFDTDYDCDCDSDSDGFSVVSSTYLLITTKRRIGRAGKSRFAFEVRAESG